MIKPKQFILFFLIFYSVKNFAQFKNGDPCDRKSYRFTDTPTTESMELMNLNFDIFLKNLIKKKHNACDTTHIISTRDNLLPFKQSYCVPNHSQYILLDSINNTYTLVSVETKDTIYKVDSLCVGKGEAYEDLWPPFYWLKCINNKEYLGWVEYNGEKEISVSEISLIRVRIKGEDLYIPIKLFRDLKNPNLCHTVFSLKPIEVYYSKQTESIYIYIYGEYHKSDLEIFKENDIAFAYNTLERNSTYLCKIIIDKNKNISRIVVPALYLYYYGWSSCIDFWVF